MTLMDNDLSAEWHTDQHKITLMLSGDEILVSTYCPNGKVRGECFNERLNTCVVNYFMDLYGLECNVGVARVEPNMEIAWSLVGDPYDLDASQLWVMPVEDTAFSSWLTERNVGEEDDGSVKGSLGSGDTLAKE